MFCLSLVATLKHFSAKKLNENWATFELDRIEFLYKKLGDMTLFIVMFWEGLSKNQVSINLVISLVDCLPTLFDES